MGKMEMPLSELLRPRQLGDLTLPLQEIKRLQRMVETGNIMSMMFHGQPGLGKTSAARILISELHGKDNCLEVNGSAFANVDFVRDRIMPFVTSVRMFSGAKICFIDEADFMPGKAQAALRHLIEKSYGKCQFLFTANNIGKLDGAIRSRLLLVDFDISFADQDEVLERLCQHYERRLPDFGIKFDSQRLREIVAIYFPDLRTVANRLEAEFRFGGV